MMFLDDEDEEMVSFLVDMLAHIPWVENGPGLCASHYSPIYFIRLLVRPRNYTPCFLSHEMMEGTISIRTHLTNKHGLTYRRVKRLRPDNCYRLHDLLHQREKETKDVQRDNDSRESWQRPRVEVYSNWNTDRPIFYSE